MSASTTTARLGLPGRLATLLIAAAALSVPASAQGRRPAPKPPEKKKEEAKPEPPPRWFAVHAGTVQTLTQGVLRDVTILSKNGKISAIGRDLVLPKGTEELDARAYRVYPGLVAYNSFGIVSSSPADGTDVFGLNLVLALSQGITTVGVGNNLAKLTYGTLEGHAIGPRAMVVRLSLRSGSMRARLREDLEKVRAYERAARAAQLAKARGETVTPPKKLSGKLALYARMLAGDVWGSAKANTRSELARLAKLAEDFGFKVLIEGGAEAWTMAPRLARIGCRVIVTPRARMSEDEQTNRPNGWSIENAAILHKHGIRVAIMSQQAGIGLWGLAGNDLFTLALEGAFAVRGGLSEKDALEALTLNPARFMGIDDQIGSIEVGKDCDLIVIKGNLLDYKTLPAWTVVNGRIAYDKQKDTLLRHVRESGPKGEVPTLWPRRKGSQQPAMPKTPEEEEKPEAPPTKKAPPAKEAPPAKTTPPAKKAPAKNGK